jgi:S-DNA-T family DNA segregation ATPase FtsK/SpoIIIE
MMGERELEKEIARHQQAVRELQANIGAAQMRAVGHARALRASATARFEERVRNSARQSGRVAELLPPYLRHEWPAPLWEQWQPTAITPPTFLVAGELRDQRGEEFRLPHAIPFIGQGCTVVVPGRSAATEYSLGLLHALVLRTALMLPHQVRYTFIDPAQQGRAFPMVRALPAGMVRVTSTADVFRDLDEVRRDIDRINAAYLDKEVTSFERLPNEVRVNERFELIFVAQYPEGFDRRALELLRQISRNGPPAGKYLFVHWNQDLEGPRDAKLGDFERIYQLGESPHRNYRLLMSAAPDPVLERELLRRLAAAKPPERKLGWADVVQPSAEPLWTESSARRIETPVGGSGVNQTVKIWFGANHEGRTCAHGVLGAMPGAGKSNLYHVLILGLATRYSPEELRLYLIDGKFGVEFEDYRDLPHADVVSLHTPPELSRSVLVDLLQELERRNTMFARSKVADLTSYREAGQPLGPLPRILLLVDEYQELFDDDREGIASKQLLQLAQQGRSAGIHMLLGAQTFNVTGLMHQAAVMGSMHLRIAMQLPHDAIQALTEFGREGRRRIAECDLPGKVVINDNKGDDAGNLTGKVAYLDTRVRREWLARLQEKAERELPESLRGRGIVCDGEAQPRFIENPYVRNDLRAENWRTAREREALARGRAHEGGLDVDDWFTGERPFALWLGQEFNVGGHARLVLRRRQSEAAVVVGGAHSARYGMFAGMLLSLAVSAPPGTAALGVIDCSVPEAPWHNTLSDITGALAERGFQVRYERRGPEADAHLIEVAAEVERRRALPESALLEEPSYFLFVADADRLRSLERPAGRYGLENSEIGKRLHVILLQGPSVGVHVVLGFTGYLPLTQTLDPKRIEDFRHRIALQIGEDDSFSLVRSRRAALLQAAGPNPITALYCDVIGGNEARFKPYTVDEKSNWEAQVRTVSERLREWRA